VDVFWDSVVIRTYLNTLSFESCHFLPCDAMLARY